MSPPREETHFPGTPVGWAQRWQVELDAAHKATDASRSDGRKAELRYLDEEKSATESPERHWNLWYSSVSIMHALLFDQVPKVGVERKHNDAADDVARVAATILERLLNGCLDENDAYTLGLGQALQDYLLAGLGLCRVRFDVEMEEVQGVGPDGVTAVVQERPRPGSEKVEVDFTHWEDVRWSPGARVPQEIEWMAFASLLSRRQLVSRFGAELGGKVPLNVRQDSAEEAASPYDRARVWEVWDKATRHVYYFVEGYHVTLGGQQAPEAGREEDPLGLPGFFPCPRPMLANTITRRVVPRPDYCLVRDLLGEIDMLQTRLYLLAEAVRVAGVYDKDNAGISRLLDNKGINELIAVDRWAAFAEAGGVRGAIDWLPLEQVVSSMATLEARQERLKTQVYEVTGMSDILRGQGQGPGVTFGEQALKARFASARLRQIQKEFARFASDLARLRAEVICRKFSNDAILAQANMASTPDMRLALAAVELLRSPALPYRVTVKPESLALSDFSQRQSERAQALQAVGGFTGAISPLIQQMPGAMVPMLRVLQWMLAGVPGADEVESIFDEAIAQAQQAAAQPKQQAPPPPDPKLVVQQMKGQQDLAKVDAEKEADLTRIAAETQARAVEEQIQRRENVQEAKEKALVAMQTRAMTGGQQV